MLNAVRAEMNLLVFCKKMKLKRLMKVRSQFANLKKKRKKYVLIKSKFFWGFFFFAAASSRRSSDQLDLMVDGLPVSLPSYEEAVYGSWGQRIPACSAPGPTQLLLAQGAAGCRQSSSSPPLSDGSQRPLLSGQSPDNPPPPYEEVPRPPSLSDDKET